MNCCAEFTRMKEPDLEPPKQLDRLFPGSFHKLKFHIFYNRSKCSINVLVPFKYNNICDSCDIQKDKDKSGEIMAKKIFVLH